MARGECVVSGHSDTWHGGEDTWYSSRETRAQWRTCHCPVCDQALGWQWRTERGYDWLGLRLGSVSDWSDFLMGPLADLPYLMKSFGK